MLSEPVGAGTISITSPVIATTYDVLNPAESVQADPLSGPGASEALDSFRMSRQARIAAGSSLPFSNPLLATSPSLEQGGTWISSTIATPAGGPAAPIATQDLGRLTGSLLDYACTLSRNAMSFKGSSGDDESVASTVSERHPTIVAAPEPDQLAYAAGAGAICGVWHLRRFRRSRSSCGGVTAAVA